MIEVARRKAARAGAAVDFRVGLIEDIPFPDDQFDIVLSSFMIFHMAEDTRRKGFSEIYRVLKPGGCLLVVDFEPPTKGLPKVIANLVLGHLLGGQEMMRHTVRELPPLMAAAGFTDIETGLTRHRALAFARALAG